MQSYSKAPEYQYNASTRTNVLVEARTRFGQEIRDGLKWVEELAKQSDIVELALHRFG